MNPQVERTIGRWLRAARGRDRYLVWNDPAVSGAPESIRLTSPAFADGAAMPERTAGPGVGANISPPLNWSRPPAETKELVLILQDPDAPLPRPVTHLVAIGISPERTGVPEGALSPNAGSGIAFARGTFGQLGYSGPQPVRGHGPHRYVFQVFALDRSLILPQAPSLKLVMAGMGGTILARGKLTGTYERP